MPHTPSAPAEPDAFDVCKSLVFESRPHALRMTPEATPLFTAVLQPTPVPGLGAGLGSMPRFRSEPRPFIGLAGPIDVRNISGGFQPTQTGNGGIAGLDLSFRGGVGLEGVIGDSGDGLVFGSIGLRMAFDWRYYR